MPETAAATAPAGERTFTFRWQGRDAGGIKVCGERQASSPALLKAELRRQGIVPLAVRKKPKSLPWPGGGRINSRDIAVFTRQLCALLGAGIPLAQALDIIAGACAKTRLRRLVLNFRGGVESGSALSEVLIDHPRHFDALYVSLVAAGESAGTLDTVLEKIADWRERVETIKARVRKALVYPAAIVAVAAIVIAMLMLFVVPQFEHLFQSHGAELPAFTAAVLQISAWMHAHGWKMLAALLPAGIALALLARRNPRTRALTDRLALHIPIIGQVVAKAAVARFARTLATSFSAGVPLADALATVTGACGNSCYARAVERMRDDVVSGSALQLAMQRTRRFPPMLVQMTAIGEETGALDAMLNKVADFFETEVDDIVNTLTGLLEPAIILLIGVLVGAMVVAMYLPVFRMAAII